MRIHVKPKDFLARFRLAASVVATTDIKPILQFVKATANKERGVTLQATDGEVAIRLCADCEVSTDGATLLPSKRLAQILDLTDEEELTLDRTDDGLTIGGADETYSCSTFLPDEFPDIEEFTETAYHEIPAKVLREMIRRTIFATDAEHQKYALGGVCFEMDGNRVSVIATDGRRLAWQEGYGKCVNDHKAETAIVPARMLQILDRILGDKCIGEDDNVKMALHVTVDDRDMVSGTVLFQCNDITLFSRLIEGRFPKWRGIIPKTEGDTPAFVKCGELLPAVLKAQVATSDDYPGIQFMFGDGILTLQGQGKETGIAKIELPLTYGGTTKTPTLDAKFMTGFLKVLSADMKLSIFLPPDNDPIKITAENDGYTYVVMPMSS